MPFRAWTAQTLPFDKLSPQDFERMCLWLVEREGYARAEHLGASGGEQGRDILAWRANKRFVFQCKKVTTFGPRDAEREILKLKGLTADERPDEAVFIVTSNVSAATRSRAREAWGDANTCNFWVGTDLDERVKRHPEILNEFFRVTRIGTDSKGDTESPRPPLLVHALLPAPRLFGRQEVLRQIESWTAGMDAPAGVLALIAVGGTGKTAIIERLLHQLTSTPRRGGLLVWSFYENPRTEEFLDVACHYFGRADDPYPTRLLRLQRALAHGEHHLLVLDGLESVQRQAHSPSANGELEDQEIKILLRRVASGLGNARILVTSRFPLVDLQSWEGQGYSSLFLDDLDIGSARAVLEAWGVRGDAESLDSVARRVGCHALSLTVMGSYLATYCGGDASRAPELVLSTQRLEDPRAARLAKLLDFYAVAMPLVQRDLLAVLSVFPGGVRAKTLSDLVEKGGDVIGAAAGLEEAEIVRLLNRLKNLGLISDLPRGGHAYWQSHPFVRDYMKELLPSGTAPVHDLLRRHAGLSLDQRPANLPTSKELLDQYEELVEHTRASGHVSDAFQLFWHAMGHYDHLGRRLAEFTRGMRIISSFSLDGTPAGLDPQLSLWERLGAASIWSIFAKHIRDVTKAIEACEESHRLAEEYVRTETLRLFARCCDEEGFIDERLFGYRSGVLRRQLHSTLQNLAELYCSGGQLPAALVAAERSVECVRDQVVKGIEVMRISAARPLHLLGRTTASRLLFQEARTSCGDKLTRSEGIWAAEHYLDCGEQAVARHLALMVLKDGGKDSPSPDLTIAAPKSHFILGRACLVLGDGDAGRHLAALQDWSERSGDMEATLAVHALAAEIALAKHHLHEANSEASTGAQIAKVTGFKLFEIRLLSLMARALLSLGQAEQALGVADDVVRMSREPSCAYAWGELSGLELAGSSYELLGRKTEAQMTLKSAEGLRERLRITTAD